MVLFIEGRAAVRQEEHLESKFRGFHCGQEDARITRNAAHNDLVNLKITQDRIYFGSRESAPAGLVKHNFLTLDTKRRFDLIPTSSYF